MNITKFITVILMLLTPSMLHSMESKSDNEINKNIDNLSQLEKDLGTKQSFQCIYDSVLQANTNKEKHLIIDNHFYEIVTDIDKLNLIMTSNNNEPVINNINKIIDEANKLNDVYPIPYNIPNTLSKIFIPFYENEINNDIDYTLSKEKNWQVFEEQYSDLYANVIRYNYSCDKDINESDVQKALSKLEETIKKSKELRVNFNVNTYDYTSAFLDKISLFYDNTMNNLIYFKFKSERNEFKIMLSKLFETKWLETFHNDPAVIINKFLGPNKNNNISFNDFNILFNNFFNNILLDSNNFKLLSSSSDIEIVKLVIKIITQHYMFYDTGFVNLQINGIVNRAKYVFDEVVKHFSVDEQKNSSIIKYMIQKRCEKIVNVLNTLVELVKKFNLNQSYVQTLHDEITNTNDFFSKKLNFLNTYQIKFYEYYSSDYSTFEEVNDIIHPTMTYVRQKHLDYKFMMKFNCIESKQKLNGKKDNKNNEKWYDVLA